MNTIKGGKADKMTAKDIAKKFNVSVEKIQSQIKKGIEIEKEHTSDKEKATEIAMDHVTEFPDYYDRIEKMEKEAKKKWENGKEKTNENIKKSIAAAALGLGLMGSPNVSKGMNLTPTTQTQTQKVLSKVNFEASQPISNPDLDLVHGALGSNRLQDDFEKRVEDELTNQIQNGNTPDVSNIVVKTYIQGDKIITKASCDIIQSQDGIAYNHFTTRGSIGSRYAERHDNQITGLIDRLENYYGGGAKQVGKPIDISFNLNGNVITYRQSFFVASDNKNTSNITNQTTQKISGADINDLRNKLNSETKDVYIDINSINVDMNNYTITYKTGDVKIYKISLLFDDSGNLDNRLRNIKSQNSTFKEVKRGSIGKLDWVISVIPYEQLKNESSKTLIKRLIRENLNNPKKKRMLYENRVSGKTIINVDIQPEYEKWITFNLSKWVNFVNTSAAQNKIIFLYNGADTLGMVSEGDYQMWLMELGIDEDVISNATFYDKGYAFFRYCMDKSIDENDVAQLVRFMISNNINDSRDIDEDMWNQFMEETGNSMEDIRTLLENADDMVSIPDLMEFLQRYSNIVLTGGGINECLKEVEIALLALDKPFNILNEFTY